MTPSISILALTMSFGAGIISFLSPCVLPLVPGYVSYVGGRPLAGIEADVRTTLTAFWLNACFVLGFSTVFIIFGASATGLGRLLLSYRYEANLVAGTTVIAFGLMMLGLIRWHWLWRDLRVHLQLPGGGPMSAYVLGLAFALGWTPCIGPVLGAILTAGAVSATVPQGIVLLSAYSIGLGLPFLAAAVFADRLLGRLKRLGRLGRWMQFGAGSVMVLMGIAMITGQLSAFSYWLLDTFPFFQRIG